jgi:hypothetical protein
MYTDVAQSGQWKFIWQSLMPPAALRNRETKAVIPSEDFMTLRLTTVHENARSALECGGLTPP